MTSVVDIFRDHPLAYYDFLVLPYCINEFVMKNVFKWKQKNNEKVYFNLSKKDLFQRLILGYMSLPFLLFHFLAALVYYSNFGTTCTGCFFFWLYWVIT